VDKMGFIYDAYKEEAWYWEMVLMLQKVLLTGVVIFLKPESTIGMAAAFTISFFFLLLHDVVQPYIDDSEDTLQRYATISMTLTLFSGILLKTEADKEGSEFAQTCFRALILLINVAVVVLFVVQALHKPSLDQHQRIVARYACGALGRLERRIKAGWQDKEGREVAMALPHQGLALRLLLGVEHSLGRHLCLEDSASSKADKAVQAPTWWQNTCLAGLPCATDPATPMDDEAVDCFRQLVQAVVKEHNPGAILDMLWILATDVIPATELHSLLTEAMPMEALVSLQDDASSASAFEVLTGLTPGRQAAVRLEEREAGDCQGVEALQDPPVINPESGDHESLDEKMRRYFLRYDLDGSGTINNNEEREQLVLALLVADAKEIYAGKKLPFTSKDVEAELGKLVPLTDENAWAPEDFELWYLEFRRRYLVSADVQPVCRNCFGDL